MIATNPATKESLWLVQNNVPFDVAMRLDDVTRAAYAIVFQEFQGRRFNWDRMDFEGPK